MLKWKKVKRLIRKVHVFLILINKRNFIAHGETFLKNEVKT